MSEAHSRRAVLRGALGYLALIPAAALVACKGNLACNDTAGLSPEEAKMRTDQNYLDNSPDPQKPCLNCAQYQAAPNPETCGSCKVLKGPINVKGTCKLWTAKT